MIWVRNTAFTSFRFESLFTIHKHRDENYNNDGCKGFPTYIKTGRPCVLRLYISHSLLCSLNI